MKNWIEIASHSELSAVQELKKSFDEGDLVDVEEGLTQLIDVMAKAEQRALLSHLINLMMHTIKWQIQPQKRTRSWLKTIFNARYEVELAQDFNPSLNENFLKSIWDKAFLRAKKGAEIETGISTTKIETLTWQEVFEQEYNL
ncbi:MAG: DUF29 domain-containing protein [Emticicia sp.]|nr:DUF29 domain-containing protein [Emticicia sp.]